MPGFLFQETGLTEWDISLKGKGIKEMWVGHGYVL